MGQSNCHSWSLGPRWASVELETIKGEGQFYRLGRPMSLGKWYMFSAF